MLACTLNQPICGLIVCIYRVGPTVMEQPMIQQTLHIDGRRRKFLIAAVAALSIAGFTVRSLAAQNANAAAEAEVRAVMQGYIDASKTPDEKAMRALFHPDALMSGSVAGGPMRIGKPEGFFTSLGKAAVGPAQPYGPASVAQVTVVGDVATGTVEESNFRGNKYTDLFQLVRHDGKWLIVSKIYAGAKAAP